MKQYMLSVAMIDGAPPRPPEEIEQAYQQVDELNAELMSTSVWVFGGGLLPASSATVVRADGDEVVVTDGPFTESKEHLGGFAIVDVADEKAARLWAGKVAVACGWPQEVRRFQPSGWRTASST